MDCIFIHRPYIFYTPRDPLMITMCFLVTTKSTGSLNLAPVLGPNIMVLQM